MRDTKFSTFSIYARKWANPINPQEFIAIMWEAPTYCALLFYYCLTFFFLFRQTVLGFERQATSELQECIFLQY